MQAEPQSIPPKIKTIAPPGLGFWAGAVTAAMILGLGAVVFFFNPSTHGFYPVCLFHELTGLNCPSCGGTRAAYALMHGHFALALKDNALFVTLLALGGGRGIWFAVRRSRRQPAGSFVPARFLGAVLVAAAVFTVLRNLPPFAFLSP